MKSKPLKIKYCRVCNERVPRTGGKGHPAEYCCDEHKKKWRRLYRHIWNKRTMRVRKVVK